MAKTKSKMTGRELYEKELEREPYYRAAPNMRRPHWNDLNEAAQQAWNRKAEEQ